jgi:predicted MPP superfamily phosphohydrolase
LIVTRVAWLTDIHLNFLDAARRTGFYQSLRNRKCDSVLVTGDIAEGNTVGPLLEEMASSLERPIYFVLGNHDFYRGSIPQVRDRAVGLADLSPHLVYLTEAGVVRLAEHTALVGHDGWADARLGDFDHSDVVLNDYVLIDELRQWRDPFNLDRPALRRQLERLADEAAEHLAEVLPQALADYRRVVVATHVPPFAECCRHGEQFVDDQWLPHFCSQAVGQLLLSTAAAHPDREILVLCGHTHTRAEFQAQENLLVLTGGAQYSNPGLQRVFEWE